MQRRPAGPTSAATAETRLEGLTPRVVITRGGQVFHRTTACGLLRDGQRFAKHLGQETHDPVIVPPAEAPANGRAAGTARFPHYKPGPAKPSSRGRQSRAAAPDAANGRLWKRVCARPDRGTRRQWDQTTGGPDKESCPQVPGRASPEPPLFRKDGNCNEGA